MVFSQNDQAIVNDKLAKHFMSISTFIVKTCSLQAKPTIVVLQLIQNYLKICISLIFDCAMFYSKNAKYKSNVEEIIYSKQINNLVNILRGYRDRLDINELLNFIEGKMNYNSKVR